MVNVRSSRTVLRRPSLRPCWIWWWFHRSGFVSCMITAAMVLAYFRWIDRTLIDTSPAERVVTTDYFNPSFRLTRHLCGGTIPITPQGRISDAHCSAASMLPSRIWPDATSPIRLRFFGSTTGQMFPDCNVPCWSGGEVTWQRTIDTTLMKGETTWTFTFSMEGPAYYPALKADPHQWRQQHFWATTSFRESEIPLPYYSRADFDIWHEAHVPFDSGLKAALFLAHNCASRNQREQVVQDLMATSFRIDALSSCLHNRDPPPQVDLTHKRHVMQQYLFYLAFENQSVDDYITEKLWGAYEAGTIPVYYGAPNVRDHAPNHSLILVDDFNTTKELAQYLEQVANNRTLYESYHAWRKAPPPLHFRAHYDMTDTHSTCRMCRWAYARMRGLGWNHTAQDLRPLLLANGGSSRDACLNPQRHFLVQHPFHESWHDAQRNEVDVKPVPSTSSYAAATPRDDCAEPLHDGNRVVQVGPWQRTLYNHDGFIDMIIEKANHSSNKSPLRLQLQTLLTAPISMRNLREGVWHLQNDVSRYTLLLSERTVQVQQPGNAPFIVDIVVSAPLRLRIVVEDVDTFHEGADQEENYFGTLAAEDFFHPIVVDTGAAVSTVVSAS